MHALAGDEAQLSVRCPAELPSGRCNNILWKVSGDQIVVSYALKSGGRVTLPMPLTAAQQTQIPCTRCGAHFWAAALNDPQWPGPDTRTRVIAARPAVELQQILSHNHREAA